MTKTASALTADNTTVEFALNDPSGMTLARPNFAVVARFNAETELKVTDTVGGSNPATLVESARRLTEVYGWAHAEVCPVVA